MRSNCRFRVICGIVILAMMPAHLLASQQPSARQVLLEADKACLEVKSISYDFDQEHFEDSKWIPVARGTVYQARADVPAAGYVSGKYFVSGSISHAGRPEEFAYSYNGVVFRIVDADSKAVLVLNSPTSYVVGQIVGMDKGVLGIPAFSSPDPFKSVIDTADKLDYEGTSDIDSVSCHIIAVTRTLNAGGRKITSTFRWYIGTKDYLPRRIQTTASRFTARNLKINQTVEESKFVVKVPQGYAEKLVTGKQADVRGLLAVNTPAPDWTLPNAQGRTTSLKDYKGKIVVMDFWGTWCVPCRESMPHVQAIHEAYKDRGVVVISLAVQDQEGDPVAYMKQYRYTYGLLLRADEVARLYKATIFPTLYVIGSDGKILHAEAGARQNMEADVRAVIDKALGAMKP
jgi:thiol-disulfide isomerase/thioredoxin